MLTLYVPLSFCMVCRRTDKCTWRSHSAGVLQPYSQLGWWQWMYYVSPFTYITEGLLGQGEPLHDLASERHAKVFPALGNQLITCTSSELVTIEPPSGLSCSAYLDPYIAFAGGYLADPNATAACAYCPFQTTDAYMQVKFNVSYGHHWRNLIIVLGVAGFNVRFVSVFSRAVVGWTKADACVRVIGLVHVCGHVLFPDTQGHGVSVGASSARVRKDQMKLKHDTSQMFGGSRTSSRFP